MKKTYTQSAEEVLRDLGVGAEGLTTPSTCVPRESPSLF